MEENDDVFYVDSNSDSEENNETIWEKKAKGKIFSTLYQKARTVLFYHHNTTASYYEFPYRKFKELATDLKVSLQSVDSASTKAFIWENVTYWLLDIKGSEIYKNLNNDDKFNLILTDFISQFINYKCESYFNNGTNKNDIQEIINDIVNKFNLFFHNKHLYIILTLLKVDVKDKYKDIQYPIYEKYLWVKVPNCTTDLVVFLALVFCYRKWKLLVHSATEKELINKIAVGISRKALRAEDNVDLTSTPDDLLPKTVPAPNSINKSFVKINQLIGTALRSRTSGTRILLTKILELDYVINKYFEHYERYIQGDFLCDTTSLLSLYDKNEQQKCDNLQEKQINISNHNKQRQQQQQQHQSNLNDINNSNRRINDVLITSRWDEKFSSRCSTSMTASVSNCDINNKIIGKNLSSNSVSTNCSSSNINNNNNSDTRNSVKSILSSNSNSQNDYFIIDTTDDSSEDEKNLNNKNSNHSSSSNNKSVNSTNLKKSKSKNILSQNLKSLSTNVQDTSSSLVHACSSSSESLIVLSDDEEQQKKRNINDEQNNIVHDSIENSVKKSKSKNNFYNKKDYTIICSSSCSSSDENDSKKGHQSTKHNKKDSGNVDALSINKPVEQSVSLFPYQKENDSSNSCRSSTINSMSQSLQQEETSGNDNKKIQISVSQPQFEQTNPVIVSSKSPQLPTLNLPQRPECSFQENSLTSSVKELSSQPSGLFSDRQRQNLTPPHRVQINLEENNLFNNNSVQQSDQSKNLSSIESFQNHRSHRSESLTRQKQKCTLGEVSSTTSSYDTQNSDHETTMSPSTNSLNILEEHNHISGNLQNAESSLQIGKEDVISSTSDLDVLENDISNMSLNQNNLKMPSSSSLLHHTETLIEKRDLYENNSSIPSLPSSNIQTSDDTSEIILDVDELPINTNDNSKVKCNKLNNSDEDILSCSIQKMSETSKDFSNTFSVSTTEHTTVDTDDRNQYFDSINNTLIVDDNHKSPIVDSNAKETICLSPKILNKDITNDLLLTNDSIQKLSEEESNNENTNVLSQTHSSNETNTNEKENNSFPTSNNKEIEEITSRPFIKRKKTPDYETKMLLIPSKETQTNELITKESNTNCSKEEEQENIASANERSSALFSNSKLIQKDESLSTTLSATEVILQSTTDESTEKEKTITKQTIASFDIQKSVDDKFSKVITEEKEEGSTENIEINKNLFDNNVVHETESIITKDLNLETKTCFTDNNEQIFQPQVTMSSQNETTFVDHHQEDDKTALIKSNQKVIKNKKCKPITKSIFYSKKSIENRSLKISDKNISDQQQKFKENDTILNHNKTNLSKSKLKPNYLKTNKKFVRNKADLYSNTKLTAVSEMQTHKEEISNECEKLQVIEKRLTKFHQVKHKTNISKQSTIVKKDIALEQHKQISTLKAYTNKKSNNEKLNDVKHIIISKGSSGTDLTQTESIISEEISRSPEVFSDDDTTVDYLENLSNSENQINSFSHNINSKLLNNQSNKQESDVIIVPKFPFRSLASRNQLRSYKNKRKTNRENNTIDHPKSIIKDPMDIVQKISSNSTSTLKSNDKNVKTLCSKTQDLRGEIEVLLSPERKEEEKSTTETIITSKLSSTISACKKEINLDQKQEDHTKQKLSAKTQLLGERASPLMNISKDGNKNQRPKMIISAKVLEKAKLVGKRNNTFFAIIDKNDILPPNLHSNINKSSSSSSHNNDNKDALTSLHVQKNTFNKDTYEKNQFSNTETEDISEIIASNNDNNLSTLQKTTENKKINQILPKTDSNINHNLEQQNNDFEVSVLSHVDDDKIFEIPSEQYIFETQSENEVIDEDKIMEEIDKTSNNSKVKLVFIINGKPVDIEHDSCNAYDSLIEEVSSNDTETNSMDSSCNSNNDEQVQSSKTLNPVSVNFSKAILFRIDNNYDEKTSLNCENNSFSRINNKITEYEKFPSQIFKYSEFLFRQICNGKITLTKKIPPLNTISMEQSSSPIKCFEEYKYQPKLYSILKKVNHDKHLILENNETNQNMKYLQNALCPDKSVVELKYEILNADDKKLQICSNQSKFLFKNSYEQFKSNEQENYKTIFELQEPDLRVVNQIQQSSNENELQKSSKQTSTIVNSNEICIQNENMIKKSNITIENIINDENTTESNSFTVGDEFLQNEKYGNNKINETCENEENYEVNDEEINFTNNLEYVEKNGECRNDTYEVISQEGKDADENVLCENVQQVLEIQDNTIETNDKEIEIDDYTFENNKQALGSENENFVQHLTKTVLKEHIETDSIIDDANVTNSTEEVRSEIVQVNETSEKYLEDSSINNQLISFDGENKVQDNSNHEIISNTTEIQLNETYEEVIEDRNDTYEVIIQENKDADENVLCEDVQQVLEIQDTTNQTNDKEDAIDCTFENNKQELGSENENFVQHLTETALKETRKLSTEDQSSQDTSSSIKGTVCTSEISHQENIVDIQNSVSVLSQDETTFVNNQEIIQSDVASSNSFSSSSNYESKLFKNDNVYESDVIDPFAVKENQNENVVNTLSFIDDSVSCEANDRIDVEERNSVVQDNIIEQKVHEKYKKLSASQEDTKHYEKDNQKESINVNNIFDISSLESVSNVTEENQELNSNYNLILCNKVGTQFLEDSTISTKTDQKEDNTEVLISISNNHENEEHFEKEILDEHKFENEQNLLKTAIIEKDFSKEIISNEQSTSFSSLDDSGTIESPVSDSIISDKTNENSMEKNEDENVVISTTDNVDLLPYDVKTDSLFDNSSNIPIEKCTLKSNNQLVSIREDHNIKILENETNENVNKCLTDDSSKYSSKSVDIVESECVMNNTIDFANHITSLDESDVDKVSKNITITTSINDKDECIVDNSLICEKLSEINEKKGGCILIKESFKDSTMSDDILKSGHVDKDVILNFNEPTIESGNNSVSVDNTIDKECENIENKFIPVEENQRKNVIATLNETEKEIIENQTKNGVTNLNETEKEIFENQNIVEEKTEMITLGIDKTGFLNSEITNNDRNMEKYVSNSNKTVEEDKLDAKLTANEEMEKDKDDHIVEKPIELVSSPIENDIMQKDENEIMISHCNEQLIQESVSSCTNKLSKNNNAFEKDENNVQDLKILEIENCDSKEINNEKEIAIATTNENQMVDNNENVSLCNEEDFNGEIITKDSKYENEKDANLMESEFENEKSDKEPVFDIDDSKIVQSKDQTTETNTEEDCSMQSMIVLDQQSSCNNESECKNNKETQQNNIIESVESNFTQENNIQIQTNIIEKNIEQKTEQNSENENHLIEIETEKSNVNESTHKEEKEPDQRITESKQLDEKILDPTSKSHRTEMETEKSNVNESNDKEEKEPDQQITESKQLDEKMRDPTSKTVEFTNEKQNNTNLTNDLNTLAIEESLKFDNELIQDLTVNKNSTNIQNDTKICKQQNQDQNLKIANTFSGDIKNQVVEFVRKEQENATYSVHLSSETMHLQNITPPLPPPCNTIREDHKTLHWKKRLSQSGSNLANQCANDTIPLNSNIITKSLSKIDQCYTQNVDKSVKHVVESNVEKSVKDVVESNVDVVESNVDKSVEDVVESEEFECNDRRIVLYNEFENLSLLALAAAQAPTISENTKVNKRNKRGTKSKVNSMKPEIVTEEIFEEIRKDNKQNTKPIKSILKNSNKPSKQDQQPKKQAQFSEETKVILRCYKKFKELTHEKDLKKKHICDEILNETTETVFEIKKEPLKHKANKTFRRPPSPYIQETTEDHNVLENFLNTSSSNCEGIDFNRKKRKQQKMISKNHLSGSKEKINDLCEISEQTTSKPLDSISLEYKIVPQTLYKSLNKSPSREIASEFILPDADATQIKENNLMNVKNEIDDSALINNYSSKEIITADEISNQPIRKQKKKKGNILRAADTIPSYLLNQQVNTLNLSQSVVQQTKSEIDSKLQNITKPTEQIGKRKRGRPPKTKTTTSEILLSNFEPLLNSNYLHNTTQETKSLEMFGTNFKKSYPEITISRIPTITKPSDSIHDINDLIITDDHKLEMKSAKEQEKNLINQTTNKKNKKQNLNVEQMEEDYDAKTTLFDVLALSRVSNTISTVCDDKNLTGENLKMKSKSKNKLTTMKNKISNEIETNVLSNKNEILSSDIGKSAIKRNLRSNSYIQTDIYAKNQIQSTNERSRSKSNSEIVESDQSILLHHEKVQCLDNSSEKLDKSSGKLEKLVNKNKIEINSQDKVDDNFESETNNLLNEKRNESVEYLKKSKTKRKLRSTDKLKNNLYTKNEIDIIQFPHLSDKSSIETTKEPTLINNLEINSNENQTGSEKFTKRNKSRIKNQMATDSNIIKQTKNENECEVNRLLEDKSNINKNSSKFVEKSNDDNVERVENSLTGKDKNTTVVPPPEAISNEIEKLCTKNTQNTTEQGENVKNIEQSQKNTEENVNDVKQPQINIEENINNVDQLRTSIEENKDPLDSEIEKVAGKVSETSSSDEKTGNEIIPMNIISIEQSTTIVEDKEKLKEYNNTEQTQTLVNTEQSETINVGKRKRKAKPRKIIKYNSTPTPNDKEILEADNNNLKSKVKPKKILFEKIEKLIEKSEEEILRDQMRTEFTNERTLEPIDLSSRSIIYEEPHSKIDAIKSDTHIEMEELETNRTVAKICVPDDKNKITENVSAENIQFSNSDQNRENIENKNYQNNEILSNSHDKTEETNVEQINADKLIEENEILLPIPEIETHFEEDINVQDPLSIEPIQNTDALNSELKETTENIEKETEKLEEIQNETTAKKLNESSTNVEKEIDTNEINLPKPPVIYSLNCSPHVEEEVKVNQMNLKKPSIVLTIETAKQTKDNTSTTSDTPDKNLQIECVISMNSLLESKRKQKTDKKQIDNQFRSISIGLHAKVELTNSTNETDNSNAIENDTLKNTLGQVTENADINSEKTTKETISDTTTNITQNQKGTINSSAGENTCNTIEKKLGKVTVSIDSTSDTNTCQTEVISKSSPLLEQNQQELINLQQCNENIQSPMIENNNFVNNNENHQSAALVSKELNKFSRNLIKRRYSIATHETNKISMITKRRKTMDVSLENHLDTLEVSSKNDNKDISIQVPVDEKITQNNNDLSLNNLKTLNIEGNRNENSEKIEEILKDSTKSKGDQIIENDTPSINYKQKETMEANNNQKLSSIDKKNNRTDQSISNISKKPSQKHKMKSAKARKLIRKSKTKYAQFKIKSCKVKIKRITDINKISNKNHFVCSAKSFEQSLPNEIHHIEVEINKKSNEITLENENNEIRINKKEENEEPQKEMDEEPQKEMDEEPQKEMDVEPQKEMDKEPQKEMDEEPQKEKNEEPQKEKNEELQKEKNEEPQKEKLCQEESHEEKVEQQIEVVKICTENQALQSKNTENNSIEHNEFDSNSVHQEIQQKDDNNKVNNIDEEFETIATTISPTPSQQITQNIEIKIEHDNSNEIQAVQNCNTKETENENALNQELNSEQKNASSTVKQPAAPKKLISFSDILDDISLLDNSLDQQNDDDNNANDVSSITLAESDAYLIENFLNAMTSDKCNNSLALNDVTMNELDWVTTGDDLNLTIQEISEKLQILSATDVVIPEDSNWINCFTKEQEQQQQQQQQQQLQQMQNNVQQQQQQQRKGDCMINGGVSEISEAVTDIIDSLFPNNILANADIEEECVSMDIILKNNSVKTNDLPASDDLEKSNGSSEFSNDYDPSYIPGYGSIFDNFDTDVIVTNDLPFQNINANEMHFSQSTPKKRVSNGHGMLQQNLFSEKNQQLIQQPVKGKLNQQQSIEQKPQNNDHAESLINISYSLDDSFENKLRKNIGTSDILNNFHISEKDLREACCSKSLIDNQPKTIANYDQQSSECIVQDTVQVKNISSSTISNRTVTSSASQQQVNEVIEVKSSPKTPTKGSVLCSDFSNVRTKSHPIPFWKRNKSHTKDINNVVTPEQQNQRKSSLNTIPQTPSIDTSHLHCDSSNSSTTSFSSMQTSSNVVVVENQKIYHMPDLDLPSVSSSSSSLPSSLTHSTTTTVNNSSLNTTTISNDCKNTSNSVVFSESNEIQNNSIPIKLASVTDKLSKCESTLAPSLPTLITNENQTVDYKKESREVASVTTSNLNSEVSAPSSIDSNTKFSNTKTSDNLCSPKSTEKKTETEKDSSTMDPFDLLKNNPTDKIPLPVKIKTTTTTTKIKRTSLTATVLPFPFPSISTEPIKLDEPASYSSPIVDHVCPSSPIIDVVTVGSKRICPSPVSNTDSSKISGTSPISYGHTFIHSPCRLSQDSFEKLPINSDSYSYRLKDRKRKSSETSPIRSPCPPIHNKQYDNLNNHSDLNLNQSPKENHKRMKYSTKHHSHLKDNSNHLSSSSSSPYQVNHTPSTYTTTLEVSSVSSPISSDDSYSSSVSAKQKKLSSSIKSYDSSEESSIFRLNDYNSLSKKKTTYHDTSTNQSFENFNNHKNTQHDNRECNNFETNIDSNRKSKHNLPDTNKYNKTPNLKLKHTISLPSSSSSKSIMIPTPSETNNSKTYHKPPATNFASIDSLVSQPLTSSHQQLTKPQVVILEKYCPASSKNKKHEDNYKTNNNYNHQRKSSNISNNQKTTVYGSVKTYEKASTIESSTSQTRHQQNSNTTNTLTIDRSSDEVKIPKELQQLKKETDVLEEKIHSYERPPKNYGEYRERTSTIQEFKKKVEILLQHPNYKGKKELRKKLEMLSQHPNYKGNKELSPVSPNILDYPTHNSNNIRYNNTYSNNNSNRSNRNKPLPPNHNIHSHNYRQERFNPHHNVGGAVPSSTHVRRPYLFHPDPHISYAGTHHYVQNNHIPTYRKL